VSPKEPSDFLVEQRAARRHDRVLRESHVLKREYGDEGAPFGWMQDGVFELFEREGRLYRWQNEEELADVTEELP